MLSQEELEELTTNLIDKETNEMLELSEKGGFMNECSESIQVLGSLDFRSGARGVLRERILPH